MNKAKSKALRESEYYTRPIRRNIARAKLRCPKGFAAPFIAAGAPVRRPMGCTFSSILPELFNQALILWLTTESMNTKSRSPNVPMAVKVPHNYAAKVIEASARMQGHIIANKIARRELKQANALSGAIFSDNRLERSHASHFAQPSTAATLLFLRANAWHLPPTAFVFLLRECIRSSVSCPDTPGGIDELISIEALTVSAHAERFRDAPGPLQEPEGGLQLLCRALWHVLSSR